MVSEYWYTAANLLNVYIWWTSWQGKWNYWPLDFITFQIRVNLMERLWIINWYLQFSTRKCLATSQMNAVCLTLDWAATYQVAHCHCGLYYWLGWSANAQFWFMVLKYRLKIGKRTKLQLFKGFRANWICVKFECLC